jgi:two-component system NtrC family response regulator
MAKPKLLIVEDDEGLCSQYRWAFPACDVLLSHTRQQAIGLVKRDNPPVAIVDLGLPPDPDGVSEGFATIDEVLRIAPRTKIVVATGNGARKHALMAVGLGAYDFCEKTVEIEVLRTIVDRGLNLYRLEEENRRLANVPVRSPIGRIVTASVAMLKLCRDVEKLATTHVPVLLLGESGTGKEALAAALHELGPRAKHPFVAINCGAIPENLLESELFGHERGAFTGAIQQKVGRFELAHQGTLFLDEVGDLPLELQPKLLRAIQEREFERLGSNRTIHVDVRLIAATHRDLAAMVAEGSFRSDLFYRFNVFPIRVPPLRERKEDIPSLVRHFTQKFALAMGRRIERIPTTTMEALVHWPWPGNIRELQNLVERSVILSPGAELRVPLAELQGAPEPGDAGPAKSLEDVEREHILQVLEQSRWVLSGPSGAAARLGIKRTTLINRLKKLGISRPAR